MNPELIKTIKDARTGLGKVIVEMEPVNATEWDCHDRLTQAYKQLRSIELDKLGQLPLPDPPAAPKEQMPLPDPPAETIESTARSIKKEPPFDLSKIVIRKPEEDGGDTYRVAWGPNRGEGTTLIEAVVRLFQDAAVVRYGPVSEVIGPLYDTVLAWPESDYRDQILLILRPRLNAFPSGPSESDEPPATNETLPTNQESESPPPDAGPKKRGRRKKGQH